MNHRPHIRAVAVVATIASLAGVSTVMAGEKCGDRRIVRFGETTASIARRCGVTPESIERRNPGLHTQGAQIGVRIIVPDPALPSPQIRIGGNSAISGVSRFDVPVMR